MSRQQIIPTYLYILKARKSHLASVEVIDMTVVVTQMISISRISAVSALLAVVARTSGLNLSCIPRT